MKDHIIRLLLEEYKQNCLLNELAGKGIDMRLAAINIYNIIFDLLEFPEDGSPVPQQALRANPGYNKASILNGCFTRDYVYDKYNQAFNAQTSDYKVIADESRLRFEAFSKSMEWITILTSAF